MDAPSLLSDGSNSKKVLENPERVPDLPPEQARLAMLDNQLKEKELLLKEEELKEKRESIRRNSRSTFLQKEFLIALVTSLAGIIITIRWNDNDKIMMRSEISSKLSIIQKLEESIASERKTTVDILADLKLQRMKLETEFAAVSRENSELEKRINSQKLDYDNLLNESKISAHRKHEELANALRAIIAVMNRGDEEFRRTKDLFQSTSESAKAMSAFFGPNQNEEQALRLLKFAILDASGSEKALSEAAISHLMTCRRLLSSRTDDVTEIATDALAKHGEFYPQQNFKPESQKSLKAIPKGIPVR